MALFGRVCMNGVRTPPFLRIRCLNGFNRRETTSSAYTVPRGFDHKRSTCTKRRLTTTAKVPAEVIRLEISDPAAILNGIATKYESSTRLLMEYVDNSLDSAEELYRNESTVDAGHSAVPHPYPNSVKVHVGIDRKSNSIWISDNCGGISSSTLLGLISKIGSSQKKHVPWLNGQFGFGIHAFRAACQSLLVFTKQAGEPMYHLEIDRSQSEMQLPQRSQGDLTQNKDVQNALALGLLGDNATFFEHHNTTNNNNTTATNSTTTNNATNTNTDNTTTNTNTTTNNTNTNNAANNNATTNNTATTNDNSNNNDNDNNDNAAGTIMCLKDFDSVWFKTIGANAVAKEIEKHFENLLRRPGVTVSVSEQGISKPRSLVCQPFEYNAIDGVHIDRVINISDDNEPLVCKFVVSQKVVAGKRPRFFKHARCINTVAQLQSFMQDSKYKQGVWDHPSLSGYIEVGDALNPVITRDEFAKTAMREKLYAKLRPVEDALYLEIHSLNMKIEDNSMSDLEQVLYQTVSQIAKTDKAAFAIPNLDDDDVDGGDGDAEEDVDTKIVKDAVTYTPIKKSETKKVESKATDVREKRKQYDIRFVNVDPEDSSTSQRSFVSGTTLYINIAHIDFRQRLHQDSKDRSRFNSRVAAYLANEIACYYRGNFYEKFDLLVPTERVRLYNELCDSVNSLENVLVKKIAGLERKLKSKERWTANAQSHAEDQKGSDNETHL